MELRYPWLVVGLAALVAVVLVGVALLRGWRPGGRPRDALLVAHAARLRDLPRFQALVRRRLLLTSLRAAGALLACAGTILLAGRLQSVAVEEESELSRDIMLCLDASTSMTEANVAVIEQFQEIVDGLEGDRIGLTIFSGSAITIFPLTDDYAYVREELETAGDRLAAEDYDYVVGTFTGESASQMGDGLVSCAQRFDRTDEERGRALVLASDNDPQGEGIYSLEEGAQYVADRDIVAYGIAADSIRGGSRQEEEFTSAMELTGGTYASLRDDGSGRAAVEAIEQIERTRIDLPPRTLVTEEPVPGTILLGGGIALFVLAWVAEAVLGRRGRSR